MKTLIEISTHKAIQNSNNIDIYIKGIDTKDWPKEDIEKYPHWFKDELMYSIPLENKDDLLPMFENFKEVNRIFLDEANNEFS